MGRLGGKDKGLFERPVGSGVWWVRWTVAGKDQKRKIGAKRDAQRALVRLRSEALDRANNPEPEQELTFREMATNYRDEWMANKKSFAWDERSSKLWVKELEDRPISSIQPGDLEKVKARWLRELAPGTVNRRLAFLKTLFGKALRDGKIARNPVAAGRVKMLRENPAERPILSIEQESAALAASSQKDGLAIVLALHTGLRISEQVERRRTDVNLQAGILTVPEAKGGGRQQIRLDVTAKAVLSLILASHDSEWIFPSRSGLEHERRESLARRFRKTCDSLGLKDVSWHCLRHTYVSRLVMLGIPIVTVQRLARHKSIQMTLRYAHLAPDHTEEALAKLSSAYPFETKRPDIKPDTEKHRGEKPLAEVLS